MTVLYIYIYLYYILANLWCAHHTYSNNCAKIRYNDTQTCDKHPPGFGQIRPSSGRYSTKKNTLMASYIIAVQ